MSPEQRADIDAWLAQVLPALDLPPSSVDENVVLDLARDAAHGVARPAAPLTTFLLGLAAGRAGGSAEDVARLAREITELLK